MRAVRRFGKSIKKFLTRKIGPLPLWGAVVVAGVGVYAYRRHKAGAGQAGGSGNDPGTGNQAYTSPTTPPDLYYQPGGNIPIGPPGGLPASGGDLAGLLALLRSLIKNNKRKHKHKHGHDPHGGHPGPHPGHPKRPRSRVHYRHEGGGRVKRSLRARFGVSGIASHVNHSKGGYPHGLPRHPRPSQIIRGGSPRGRPTIPVVAPKTVSTSHPEVAFRPAHREPVGSPPRPSAPPQRTMRRQGK